MEGQVLVARRLVPVAAMTILMSAFGAPAPGAAEISSGWNEATGIYEMVFPVDGDHRYGDNWGACRGYYCSRLHEGIDIMAPKMTPVVAVASGTVGWMRNERGGDCCSMALDHDDGWRTWYIHMNNDTPGTDDGRGWGFAPGITSGVHVEAGQLIGYVGDSGNAETTPPHLHFELQQPDGIEINPYDHLFLVELSAAETDIPLTGGDTAGGFINMVLVLSPSEGAPFTTLEWEFIPDDPQQSSWRIEVRHSVTYVP